MTAEYWARPVQLLSMHLKTVANNIKKRLECICWGSSPFINENDKGGISEKDWMSLIINLGYLIGLTHDIGKVSPYFQAKISPKTEERRLKPSQKQLSWHTTSSALFTYFIIDSFLSNEHGERHFTIQSEVLRKCLRVIGLLVVANHHSKSLTAQVNEIFQLNGFLDDQVTLVKLLVIHGSEFVNRLDIDERTRNLFVKTIEQLTKYQNKEELEDLLLGIDTEVDDTIENLTTSTNSLYFLYGILFSVLCDADEWDAKHYDRETGELLVPMDEQRTEIPSDLVDNYISRKSEENWIFKKWPKELVNLRSKLYLMLDKQVSIDKIGKILSLSAPTGMGKTLAMLNYAFKLRRKYKETTSWSPRIIYCLPFISIIDQVATELIDILGIPDEIQCKELTVDHHLASIEWDPLNEDEDLYDYLDIRGIRDFVKLWRSDIIVTTFVKFWHTVISGTKRRIVGLNRIAGSIILLDEVQNIPSYYWDITYHALAELTRNYGCTVILSSATQPLIAPPAETLELTTGFYQLVTKSSLIRYQLFYNPNSYHLDEFCEELESKLSVHGDFFNKNVMIVMNTKKNARFIFNYLNQCINHEKRSIPFGSYELYFLSTWVIPIHRKIIIEHLFSDLDSPHSKPVILVCTQVIEAGVDVSFDIVCRDFGPLDSLIQVAGRCNRHFQNPDLGEVYIYHIQSDEGYKYSQIVYQDPIIENVTEELLKSHSCPLTEHQLHGLGNQYFQLLRERKNTKACVKAIKDLNFHKIITDFHLIQDDVERKMLFIPWDEDAKKTLKQVEFQLEKSTKSRITINPNFYRYILNLRENELSFLQQQTNISLRAITIETELKYKKIRRKDGNRVLFYVIEDFNSIYDEAGLNLA